MDDITIESMNIEIDDMASVTYTFTDSADKSISVTVRAREIKLYLLNHADDILAVTDDDIASAAISIALDKYITIRDRRTG